MVKTLGGLNEIEKNNQIKANSLYDYISSNFYKNNIDAIIAKMNVVFNIVKAELVDVFVRSANEHGIYGLKVHKHMSRASIYNATKVLM